MNFKQSLVDAVKHGYAEQPEVITLNEYIDRVAERPMIAATAHQRIYEMIRVSRCGAAAQPAVIFLAMDVSGSMNVDRKPMARLFFSWCVQFLRSRYELTEIVFLAHTTEAREVDEEQFFGRVESGGTKVSSVFEAVQEIQRDRCPADDWNIYVLHVSDGDNFTADNQRALELIRRLTEVCSLVGYLEVNPGSGSSHKLSKYYEEEAADLDGFVSAHATDDRSLWPALRAFFAAANVEAAIR